MLTRYLYDRRYVEQSLLASLANHDRDQSRFWAFELYHSGFQEATIQLLIEFYYRLYVNRYPNLEEFIVRQLNGWDDDKDWIVGTIIENFIIRKPDIELYNASNPWIERIRQIKTVDEGYLLLDEFCGSDVLRNSLHVDNCPSSLNLFKYACISRIERTVHCNDRRVFVVLSCSDVLQYRNRPFVQGKGWKILRRVCRFPVYDLSYAEGICYPDENWLSTAYKTPIWKRRIRKYGGKLIEGTVVFDNEETETEFRSWYDLEPDEQPLAVKNCWRGIRPANM